VCACGLRHLCVGAKSHSTVGKMCYKTYTCTVYDDEMTENSCSERHKTDETRRRKNTRCRYFTVICSDNENFLNVLEWPMDLTSNFDYY
jgi:hypothetical protein